jgi:hypothetical protein
METLRLRRAGWWGSFCCAESVPLVNAGTDGAHVLLYLQFLTKFSLGPVPYVIDIEIYE